MKRRDHPSLVRVGIFGLDGSLIGSATASLKPAGKRARGTVGLRYNKRLGGHVAQGVAPGRYVLTASANGLETQRRPIDVPDGPLDEVVILGRRGLPYYYRRNVKVPFQPRVDLIAASFRGSLREIESRAGEIARRLKLEMVPLTKQVLEEYVRVFRIPGRPSVAEQQRLVTELTHQAGVRYAGPVVAITQESVGFLTDEIVAKFESAVERNEAAALAKRLKLTIIRPIPYAGNAFLLRAAEARQVLAACDALVESERVVYAEPNLVVSAVDDQIVPTDFLFPQQWHATLVNLPQAWESLQGLNAPGVMQGDPGDLTFGGENITIAVMDRGIQSQTVMAVVQPAHPDFIGNITSGAPKISQYFDFATMVANNNNPPNNHGMGCAGVAAALANNPSVVMGENEGVAGAAPNCPTMGLIRPAGGTEVQYADAYIWTAGFNPLSTQAGFPAPIAPGADIITNSFGESTGAPISGLMRDCFDYLTTYGRGGKGVVLCFSAGNGNTDFRLPRPWAAYEKTIAVAASTNADVRANYSNFGPGIDLCAPSSNGIGIVSGDLLGGGNLAGHTGGNNDYTNTFGGTSSSTPLVAGVAALVLSARPDLTWVEVRDLLRSTAVPIDTGNVNPIGQWTDTDGDGNIDYSQWYGFGRLDAQAAVDAAIVYDFGRDLVVRDTLADVGTVPVGGAFWVSPDLWVRTADPAVDGGAALPATYADPPPHQAPIAGQDNFVYVRLRNNGTIDSLPFYVRVYLTHWAGTEFVYPDDFIPTNRPGDPLPMPMTPGTYLIGELRVDTLAAATSTIVNMTWPQALVPPEEVLVNGSNVRWHPCLLVECSPHDGPAATGPYVWDNNNLAQRNLTIVYPDDDGFAAGMVIGNRRDPFPYAILDIDRGRLPRTVRLYVEILDERAVGRLEALIRDKRLDVSLDCCELTIVSDTRIEIGCKHPLAITLPATSRLGDVSRHLTGLPVRGFTLGFHRGRRVAWLDARTVVRIPIIGGAGALVPIVVGGTLSAPLPKTSFPVHVTQRNPDGQVVGGVTVEIDATR